MIPNTLQASIKTFITEKPNGGFLEFQLNLGR